MISDGDHIRRDAAGHEVGDAEPLTQLVGGHSGPSVYMIGLSGCAGERDEPRTDRIPAGAGFAKQPTMVDEFTDNGVCGGSREPGVTDNLR